MNRSRRARSAPRSPALRAGIATLAGTIAATMPRATAAADGTDDYPPSRRSITCATSSSSRTTLKQQSLERVLEAASRRIREEGLSGAAIATVMSDAGLTHGAFYSHFDSKGELETAAFSHATAVGRSRWVPSRRGGRWDLQIKNIANRYLTVGHRDDLADSCGFPALVSEAAHASAQFRAAYERELSRSLDAICGEDAADAARREDALTLMIICVGGLSLSRAVRDGAFSAQILRAARRAAARLANSTPP